MYKFINNFFDYFNQKLNLKSKAIVNILLEYCEIFVKSLVEIKIKEDEIISYIKCA